MQNCNSGMRTGEQGFRNSGYAGHRLFDRTSTLKFAQKAGGMSDRIWGEQKKAAE